VKGKKILINIYQNEKKAKKERKYKPKAENDRKTNCVQNYQWRQNAVGREFPRANSEKILWSWSLERWPHP